MVAERARPRADLALLWFFMGLVTGFGGFVLIPGLIAYSAISHPYICLPLLALYGWWSFDGSERRDGRHWHGFSRGWCVLRWMREDFFDIAVVVSDELQREKAKAASLNSSSPSSSSPDAAPDRQYIFAVHPHGVLSDFRVLIDGILNEHLGDDLSIKTLAASACFLLPPLRELCLWTGCIDASRKTAERALSKKHSVLVIPGGEKEQVRTTYGEEKVYLAKRMGFVRLALKHNVPLVPVYVFGANDVYRTTSAFQSIRERMVDSLRFCIPVCWGMWGLPATPLQIPLTVVFGKPVRYQRKKDGGDDISREELEAAHGEYMQALKSLFDENKGKYGYAQRELIIE